MAWDSGWRDTSPDIAEVVDPPRRRGWLRPVAGGLVLLVAGLLVFVRLTSPVVRADTAPASFLDSYTVELDIQLTNTDDNHLEITPALRPLAGMEFRGARDAAHQPVHGQHPLELPAQGRATLSLLWRIADCKPGRMAKDAEVTLPLGSGRTPALRRPSRCRRDLSTTSSQACATGNHTGEFPGSSGRK
jgi:hypothetical protein